MFGFAQNLWLTSCDCVVQMPCVVCRSVRSEGDQWTAVRGMQGEYTGWWCCKVCDNYAWRDAERELRNEPTAYDMFMEWDLKARRMHVHSMELLSAARCAPPGLGVI